MAQESKEYLIDIQIDEGDLAAKLESVRQRVDAAMSQDLFSSPLPQASSLIEMAGIPVSMPPLAPPIPEVGYSPGFWGSIANSFDSFAQNAQLGFSRFTDDARRAALMSEQFFPQPQPFVPPSGSMHSQFGPQSYTEAIFGTGYDPTMPISRGIYDRMRGKMIGDAVGDITKDDLLSYGTIGTTVLSIGAAMAAPALAVPLGVVAMGAEIVELGYQGMKVLGREQVDIKNLSSGINAMSNSILGMNLSDTQSMSIAQNVNDLVYSRYGRASGMDFEIAQAQIGMFASNGGLSGVSNANELNERITGFLTNLREVSQNFGLFQEEAVAVMAELERKSISTASQMGDFSARMSNLARSYGMNVGDLMGTGMQTIDMFAGSGIDSNDAFNIGINSRLTAQNILQQVQGGAKAIANMGGIDQATAALSEGTVRWGLSGQGMLYTSALMGGGYSAGGDMNQFFSSAGNYLSGGMKNMVNLMANQGDNFGNTSMADARTSMVGLAMDMAEKFGLANDDGKVNEGALALMLQNTGMVSNINEGRLLVKSVVAEANRDYQAEGIAGDLASLTSFADSVNTGVFANFGAAVGERWRKMTTSKAAGDFVNRVNAFGDEIGGFVTDYINNTVTLKGKGYSQDIIDQAMEYVKDLELTDLSEDYYTNKLAAADTDEVKKYRDADFTDKEIYYMMAEGLKPTDKNIRSAQNLKVFLGAGSEFDNEFAGTLYANNNEKLDKLKELSSVSGAMRRFREGSTNDVELIRLRDTVAEESAEILFGTRNINSLNSEQLAQLNQGMQMALGSDLYKEFSKQVTGNETMLKVFGNMNISDEFESGLEQLRSKAADEATKVSAIFGMVGELGGIDSNTGSYKEFQKQYSSAIREGKSSQQAYTEAVNYLDGLGNEEANALSGQLKKSKGVMVDALSGATNSIKKTQSLAAAQDVLAGSKQLASALGVGTGVKTEEQQKVLTEAVSKVFGKDLLGSGEVSVANLQEKFSENPEMLRALNETISEMTSNWTKDTEVNVQSVMKNLASKIDMNSTANQEFLQKIDPQRNQLSSVMEDSNGFRVLRVKIYGKEE